MSTSYVTRPEIECRAPKSGFTEFLRFVACLGVVDFHVRQSSFSYNGLVVFIFLSGFFLKAPKSSKDIGLFCFDRFRRILLPWVFWFVIYLCYNIVSQKPLFPWSDNGLQCLLVGPWIGLWYLPFIYIFSIVGLVLTLFLGHLHRTAKLFAFTLLPTTAIWITTEFLDRQDAPFSQWQFAIPILFAAIALKNHSNKERISHWELSTLVLFGAIYAFVSPSKGLALTTLSVMVVTWISVKIPIQFPSKLTYLGSLSFTIYLVHGVVIGAFRFLGINSPSLLSLAAMTGAILIAVVVQRFPAFKHIMP